MCRSSSLWLHMVIARDGNFTSHQENNWEGNWQWEFWQMLGIVWKWCCVCPAYVRSPLTTELGLQEF